MLIEDNQLPEIEKEQIEVHTHAARGISDEWDGSEITGMIFI